jgi:hypothetical protein
MMCLCKTYGKHSLFPLLYLLLLYPSEVPSLPYWVFEVTMSVCVGIVKNILEAILKKKSKKLNHKEFQLFTTY